MTTRDFATALFMAFIFGLGWVFAKSAISSFPPILLASFRFGISGLVLAPFVGFPRGRLKELVIISVLAISIPYSMSYTAMQHLDVSTAVLLSQTEAPLLVVLGALLLKERLSIRQGVGIIAALVGVVIIAGDPSVRQHYLAVALSLGSVGIWALGQVQIRNMGDVGGMQNLAWIALFGSPQLLLLSVLFENGQVHAVATADIRTWAEVFYLGLGMTCVGIGIWYSLIKKLPVARVAPFLLLVPVISAAGGVLLLGESLGVLQVIGGLVIISGVFATVSASPPPPETDRELHAEDKVLGRRTIQLSQADEQRKTRH